VKPLLLLDPGHGGHKPGAIGFYEDVKVMEKEVNLNIALYTRRYIQQNADDQIITCMTRKDDTHKSLTDRAKRQLMLDCDLFVSIHCNAYDEVDDTVRGVSGIETYYYWEDAKLFANDVHQNIVKAFPDHLNRGVKKMGFKVIRDGVPEAVLIECEFIDEMPEWLNKESVQRQYGYLIGASIMGYLL